MNRPDASDTSHRDQLVAATFSPDELRELREIYSPDELADIAKRSREQSVNAIQANPSAKDIKRDFLKKASTVLDVIREKRGEIIIAGVITLGGIGLVFSGIEIVSLGKNLLKTRRGESEIQEYVKQDQSKGLIRPEIGRVLRVYERELRKLLKTSYGIEKGGPGPQDEVDALVNHDTYHGLKVIPIGRMMLANLKPQVIAADDSNIYIGAVYNCEERSKLGYNGGQLHMPYQVARERASGGFDDVRLMNPAEFDFSQKFYQIDTPNCAFWLETPEEILETGKAYVRENGVTKLVPADGSTIQAPIYLRPVYAVKTDRSNITW